MSFDRSDSSVDERADHRSPVVRSADQAPDTPQARRPVEASDTTDVAQEASRRLPTKEERIEAHRRAWLAAEEAYAPSDRVGGTKADAPAKVEIPRRPDTPRPTPEASQQERVNSGLPARTADKPSATEGALRKRVSELEADKVARDRQLAAQDVKLAVQAKTITEQGERIDRLESYVGRITTAVSELRQQQDEPRASTEIAERAGGKPEERAKPQHKRRIPTDAMNNVISIAAGGTITELAYHLRDLPPEYAGVGATGLALGAGIVAVWRERRKAGDDADHRPKG